MKPLPKRAPSGATGNDARATPPSRPGRISLYALPDTETAATIAARRALMSRKGLTVEEAHELARERRRQAVRKGRFNRTARLLALAGIAGSALAAVGSMRDSLALLLAGYALAGLAGVALLAYLTRRSAARLRPLEDFYRPDEQPATAADIALLRQLSEADPELAVITTAWWRSRAPIRKADLRLALDLQRAKLG